MVASIGAAERPSLAWNGHLDIVPVGDVRTGGTARGKATSKTARLIGRGAADMKGPVASALAAAAAIRRAGVDLAAP